MSAPCPYELCDGTGWRTDEDANTAFPCRCRPQRQNRAKARSLSAVIPRRYQGVSYDRPPVANMDRRVIAAVREYTDRIDERLDVGNGLWFIGDVGTGKTTLAMLVSSIALAAGRTVAIYSMPRLISLLRSSYADDSAHTDVELLEQLTKVDLLHLDDLGTERTNDWVLEQIYAIVNSRYEAEKSVVLTGNEDDREKLRQQLTGRTVSRLTEMCEEIPVYGEDQRLAFHRTA
ncbi:MAG: ATP-binding protein [Solirubrobacteraceae bacterium]